MQERAQLLEALDGSSYQVRLFHPMQSNLRMPLMHCVVTMVGAMRAQLCKA